ncbi:MAG: hypothetical protein AAGI48_04300 [Verrucomicrobiota bacterium]
MANVFAILTAVLLAASAFIAFKNKEAYATEIDDRQTAERNLSKSQAKLADLQKKRNDTIAEKKSTQEATVGLREEEEKQTEKIAALKKDITDKQRQVEEQAAKIAEIKEKTKDAGEIKELAGKIKRFQEEIVAYEDEKAGLEIQRTALLSERESTAATIKTYQDESRMISSQQSYGSARISSIYGPWGFVTLSAGSRGGIVSGSTLDVVRGGEPVAQLRVRSVESGRASADVIPDSLGEDVTLMVGDRVVPTAIEEGAAAAAAE